MRTGPSSVNMGLGALSVALVARSLGFGCAVLVAQVVGELGAQCTSDQRLLARHRSGIDRFAGHQTGDELVKQFLRDLGQRPGLGRDRRILQLRLAYLHRGAGSSCDASYTKI